MSSVPLLPDGTTPGVKSTAPTPSESPKPGDATAAEPSETLATVQKPDLPDPATLVEMPPEVRCLEGPWKSLCGEVPGLTEDLEKDFRFGQSVVHFAGGFRLGGSIKGGSSTIWSPVSKKEHAAYRAWEQREGMPRFEDREAFDTLLDLLEKADIAFQNVGYRASTQHDGEYIASRGFLYRTIVLTLAALPEEHRTRREFSRLQVGGWGPDSAKASAYEDGAVLLYDFAVRGARRTFAGLLLHEIGHVHETALTEAQRATLSDAHRIIGRAYALVGLEFLLDGESRKIYQQFLVNEFVAETYVVYTSQGGVLRRHIAEQVDPEVREAWQTVYRIFREGFGGMEFV